MKNKIVLLAFRKSQRKFFTHMLDVCEGKYINIISSRRSWKISLKALKNFKNRNIKHATQFAIDEFYAKNNLNIPSIFLKVYFNFLAKANFLRYYTSLDNSYSKMLIWNGGKFRQLIALNVAKLLDIEVYYFENGLLPNTMVFDTQGINYNNSVPRDKIFYETYQSTTQLPKALVPRIGKNRKTFKGDKEALPQEYIFVPFQVDADTQIISQSPWVKNMRALYAIIESVAKESPYHFVMKEHPSSGVEYPDLHKRSLENNNISFHNTYSTQELIENSMAVITINSTVGIEALLFHKKVIVLGNAFYNIEGITYGAQDINELRHILEHIKTFTPNKSLIEKLLSYLYVEYLIEKNDEMYTAFCQKITAA